VVLVTGGKKTERKTRSRNKAGEGWWVDENNWKGAPVDTKRNQVLRKANQKIQMEASVPTTKKNVRFRGENLKSKHRRRGSGPRRIRGKKGRVERFIGGEVGVKSCLAQIYRRAQTLAERNMGEWEDLRSGGAKVRQRETITKRRGPDPCVQMLQKDDQDEKEKQRFHSGGGTGVVRTQDE